VLNVERNGQVLVATMDDGKANALSFALIDALQAAVAEAETDPEVRALAIVGRPGRFSAGFDLSVIQSGDPNAVARLIGAGGDLMRTVYSSGVPVVAACTGHALAAGALLLLACDRRIGADADVKIGLNEVAIGLALPRWAVAIAADRLSRRHLQASVATAQLYDGRGAVGAGYLDRVVEVDRVVDEALAEAAGLAAALDPASYALTVKALRRSTIEQMT
jgi:enoyl-CoA hydratase